MDQVTEVTNQGWFSRIGSSVMGLFFGFILFIVGFPVLFWNEGRAVHRAQDLEEGTRNAIVLSPQKVDPNLEGKLVFLAGLATTEETLSDSQFGINAEHALALRRDVSMYQWDEKKESKEHKKLGGGTRTETTYTYKKVWSSSVIDSNQFKETSGHQNPQSMPYSGQSVRAKVITLGAYSIPDALKSSLNHWEAISVGPADLEKLSESDRARLKVANGGFYSGGDPSNPAVGDAKVSFQKVPPGDCALVALQKGDSFVPYTTRGGRELFELRSGAHTKEQFFKELVSENNLMTWILRAVGFALMLIGLLMLFKPFVVLADVVPFLGTLMGYGTFAFAFMIALAFSLTTIAIGWLTYRPLFGIGLLIAAGAVVYLLSRGGRRDSARTLPPIPSRSE